MATSAQVDRGGSPPAARTARQVPPCAGAPMLPPGVGVSDSTAMVRNVRAGWRRHEAFEMRRSISGHGGALALPRLPTFLQGPRAYGKSNRSASDGSKSKTRAVRSSINSAKRERISLPRIVGIGGVAGPGRGMVRMNETEKRSSEKHRIRNQRGYPATDTANARTWREGRQGGPEE